MHIDLFDIDKQLSAFLEDEALEIALLDDVPAPVRVVTDYAGSVFGVEALNATVDQVNTVLEKKLRENGIIDGFSEVLVHQVSRVGGYTVALYTVVPVETALTYGRAEKAHKEPCHFIPLAYALYRCALSLMDSGDVNTAVVLQHGRYLDFVLLNKRNAVAADRLVIYATASDSSKMVDQLLQAFATAEKRGAQPPTRVLWLLHGVLDNDTDTWFVDFQQQAAFCTVELGPTLPLFTQTKVGRSSAPVVFEKLSLKDIYHTKSEQQLTVLADHAMPIISSIAACCCVLLIIWNAVTYFSVLSTQHALENIEQSKEYQRFKSLHLATQTADAARNPLIKTTAEFANELQKTRVRDVRRVMKDIRASLSDLVLINRIEVAKKEDEATPTIVVEGKGIEFPGAVRGEELLSQALRNKGYEVINRSLEIKRNDNSFRFLLQWLEPK